MNKQSKKKQDLAQRMIALFYKGDEKPSPEFLQDLKQMIEGRISEQEMRNRIISRNKGN